MGQSYCFVILSCKHTVRFSEAFWSLAFANRRCCPEDGCFHLGPGEKAQPNQLFFSKILILFDQLFSTLTLLKKIERSNSCKCFSICTGGWRRICPEEQSHLCVWHLMESSGKILGKHEFELLAQARGSHESWCNFPLVAEAMSWLSTVLSEGHQRPGELDSPSKTLLDCWDLQKGPESLWFSAVLEVGIWWIWRPSKLPSKTAFCWNLSVKEGGQCQCVNGWYL